MTAAGLPKRERRISGFIPDDCRAEYQVEPGLNKAGMSNKHLHVGLELAFVPRLSVLWRRLGCEDGGFDASRVQNGFEPARHVALLSVRRIYLDGPPIFDLRLDQFDEPALFRVKDRLVEIGRVRNQESFAPFGLLVIGNAPQRSN